jgi:hypothetical protein
MTTLSDLTETQRAAVLESQFEMYKAMAQDATEDTVVFMLPCPSDATVAKLKEAQTLLDELFQLSPDQLQRATIVVTPSE